MTGAAHIYGVEGERTVLACDHMVAYAEELLRTAKSCGVEKMIFFSDHGMLDKEENFFPNIYAMEHGFEGGDPGRPDDLSHRWERLYAVFQRPFGGD